MVVDEKIQDNPVLHNGDALPSEIKTTAFHQKNILQENGLQKNPFTKKDYPRTWSTKKAF